MTRMMRCARLHQPDTPFQIDEIPVPKPGPDDVLVAVKACGVVPNMRNIVRGGHWRILPPMPAVFGLDAAGEVAELGTRVRGFEIGERVYVNPALSCGCCAYCRSGAAAPQCEIGVLQGYFGFRPGSEAMLAKYPYGGFAEFLTAPARNLVKLPPEVSFEAGARFGYLGTAYAALRAGDARPGGSLAVIGATGTLGVNVVIFALALGIDPILPIARNAGRLDQLRALAPGRIQPIPIDGTAVSERMKDATRGVGVDLVVDCLASGAPADSTEEAIMGLRRGGIAINIGALNEPVRLKPMWFMVNAIQYRGSNWFTVAQGEEMAALVHAGLVDFGVFEHRIYPLEQVNDALAEVGLHHGGFVNIVVRP